MVQSASPSGADVARADQEAGHFLDGLLGGRQTDARQPSAGQGLEALERHREMQAALVRRPSREFHRR